MRSEYSEGRLRERKGTREGVIMILPAIDRTGDRNERRRREVDVRQKRRPRSKYVDGNN